MAMNASADMIVRVGSDVKDAMSGLDQVGSAVNKTSAGFNKAGLLMGAGAGAIAGGFGLAINSAMNYEGAMADVSASLGVTGKDLDALGSLALDIGAKTAFSATEGAQAIEELGKAGLSVPTILNGAGLAAAQLASAVGTNMPTAATAMATAMNIFKMSGDQATAVADNITAAVNLSSSDIGDIQLGLANAGVAASNVGMTFEQTASAIALFASKGINGAQAGTALATSIGMLASPTAEAQGMMDELGISFQEGIESGDLMGYMAGKLKTGLSGLSEAEQQRYLFTMFGADGQKIMNVLMAEGAEGVAEMQSQITSQGQAAAASDARMQGLRGAIESLSGSAETMAIMFGQMLTPAATMVAKAVTNLVNRIIALPKGAKTAIAVGAGLVGMFLALGAGVAFLIPILGGVVGGAMALVLPFIIVAGVIAALAAGVIIAAAYFRDDLAGAFSAVTSALAPVWDGFTKLVAGMIEVFTTTGKVNEVLATLPGWLQPIARQIFRVVDAVQVLVSAFQSGGLQGLLDALPAQLSRIGDAFKRMGEIILDAITGLDWGAIGTALWNGLVAAVGFIAPIAWDIVQKLGDLTWELGQWLWEKASAVDWAGILSSAAALAGDIAWDIVQKLGDLTGAVAVWLWGQLSSVNWSGIIQSALDLMGDMAGYLFDKGYDLMVGLGRGIRDYWPTISAWLGTLGTLALGALVDLIGILVPAGRDLLIGLGRGIREYWPEVSSWLGRLGMMALEAIAELIGVLAPKGRDLLIGFGRGIREYWPEVRTWLGQLGTMALGALVDLIGVLAPAGRDLLIGFGRGIREYWPEVSSWLANMGLTILGLYVDYITLLVSVGRDLLIGLGRGIREYWPEVSSWLANMGVMILNLYVDYITLLVSVGRDLLIGLGRGIREYWPEVSSWLANMGVTILGLLVDFISILVPAGRDLLIGLGRGIREYWPTVTEWLGQIGTKALTAVGALLDTLKSKGLDLINGLGNGAREAWPAFEQAIKDIPGAIGTAIGDLSDVLYDKGVSVIQGLWDGATDKWNEFSKWLSGLDFTPWEGLAPGKGKQSGASGTPAGLGHDTGAVNGSGTGGRAADFASGMASVKVPSIDTSAQVAALNALGVAFTALTTVATSAVMALTSMVKSQFSQMTAGATAPTMALTSMVRSQLSQMTASATTTVMALTSMVRSQMAQMASQATSTANTMRGSVTSAFSALGSAVASSAQRMRSEVVSAVQSMSSQATSATNSMGSQMRSAAQTTASALGSSGQQGANAWANAMRSGFSQGVSAAQSGMSGIRGAIQSIGSQFSYGSYIGSTLGQGIASGIQSQVGAIAASAANAVNVALSSARAAAGNPHSPSPVFEDRVGIPIGQAVWSGIESQYRNIRRAAEGAVDMALVGYGQAAATITPATMRPSTVISPSGNGRSVTYNDHRTFIVKVDDLPEVAKAADFMRDIERDRALVYGAE